MGPKDAPLTEPFAVCDIYASGMAHAEDIGDGLWRFSFFVFQRPVHGGEAERVVVARLILPSVAAREAAKVALSSIGATFYRDCLSCISKSAH